MRRRSIFGTIAGVGLVAAALAACTGVPDTTFGNGGLQVLAQYGESQDVLLPNGKIMVDSLNGVQTGVGTMVVRLNPNGSPDPSYGTSGRVAVAARESALGPDGRAYFIDSQLRMTAYTAAGKQDTSFGTVTLPFTADRSSVLTGFQVAPDGDVYVSHCVFTTSCTVLRYLPSGQRDAGFVYGGSPTAAEFKAVGPDGSVYVSTQPDFAKGPVSVQKLTTTGALAQAFGQSGRLTLPANVSLHKVVVDKSNRPTMTVDVDHPDTTPIAPFVVRYTAAGKPDLRFGWNGIAGMPGSAGTHGGLLAIDRLGRAIATSSGSFAPHPLRVYRFTPTGALDQTFGINGQSVVAGVGGQQINELFTTSLTTDPANRIILGTAVPPYTKDFDGSTAVLRLTG